MEQRRVPFTFMFVAAFFVVLGIGVFTNRHAMEQRWERLHSQSP